MQNLCRGARLTSSTTPNTRPNTRPRYYSQHTSTTTNILTIYTILLTNKLHRVIQQHKHYRRRCRIPNTSPTKFRNTKIWSRLSSPIYHCTNTKQRFMPTIKRRTPNTKLTPPTKTHQKHGNPNTRKQPQHHNNLTTTKPPHHTSNPLPTQLQPSTNLQQRNNRVLPKQTRRIYQCTTHVAKNATRRLYKRLCRQRKQSIKTSPQSFTPRNHNETKHTNRLQQHKLPRPTTPRLHQSSTNQQRPNIRLRPLHTSTRPNRRRP